MRELEWADAINREESSNFKLEEGSHRIDIVIEISCAIRILDLDGPGSHTNNPTLPFPLLGLTREKILGRITLKEDRRNFSFLGSLRVSHPLLSNEGFAAAHLQPPTPLHLLFTPVIKRRAIPQVRRFKTFSPPCTSC